MSNQPAPVIHVLLVDDDDVEIMALRRALRKAATPHTLTIAHDGVEALALLRGEGPTTLGKPALIFMDLNMPRMNGHELLSVLRNDPQHAHTDVVVVTTSLAAEDQHAAWRNRVAGYIVKSSYGEGFDAFASEVEAFLERSSQTHGRMSGPLDALVLCTPERSAQLREALSHVPHVETCAANDSAISALLARSFDCLVIEARALEEPITSFSAKAAERGAALPPMVVYAPMAERSAGHRDGGGWVLCSSLVGDALHRAVIDAFALRRRDAFLSEHGSGVQVRLAPPLDREGTRRE